jgi:hypothetical protein
MMTWAFSFLDVRSFAARRPTNFVPTRRSVRPRRAPVRTPVTNRSHVSRARENDMNFHVTAIPNNYPYDGPLDLCV